MWHGGHANFRKNFLKHSLYDDQFIDGYVIKNKPRDYVLVSVDPTQDELSGLEAKIQGLPTDIVRFGMNVDTKSIVGKYNITDTELSLNDGLVGSVYNKVALKE